MKRNMQHTNEHIQSNSSYAKRDACKYANENTEKWREENNTSYSTSDFLWMGRIMDDFKFFSFIFCSIFQIIFLIRQQN